MTTNKQQIANLIAQEKRRQSGLIKAIDGAKRDIKRSHNSLLVETIKDWESDLEQRYVDYGKQV